MEAKIGETAYVFQNENVVGVGDLDLVKELGTQMSEKDSLFKGVVGLMLEELKQSNHTIANLKARAAGKNQKIRNLEQRNAYLEGKVSGLRDK